MRVIQRLSFLLGVVGLAASCGNGDGTNPPTTPTAGYECPYVGGQTCGLTVSGKDAVLSCSAGMTWNVDELCTEGCSADSGAPACLGEEPVEDLIDVANDSVVPDVAPDVAPDLVPDVPDVADDETQPDVPEVDIPPDYTPPTVLSTTPANDEMNVVIQGLVIRVVFSEPMFTPPFVPQNIKMVDANLDNIPVAIDWEDEEHTILLLTPMFPMFPAAPYYLELSSMLGDMAGNRLTEPYRFHFFTASQYNMDTYQALAGKYAPTLYIETSAQNTHLDFPTKYDFDGNWVAGDNVDNIMGATKVDPHVYYSVTETKSHYYIFYVFFFPYRFAESEGARFGNDVAGSLVVVRKSDQLPIAVETYFKVMGQDERSISYLTTDADLIPDGYTYTDYKFDGMLPREDLFPSNHYIGWISTRSHQSCLWVDLNNGYLDGCELTLGTQASMKKVAYTWKGGSVTTLNKSPSFPVSQNDVGYALEHVMDAWWPRRTDVGDEKMFASAYTYEPFTNSVFQNRPQLSNDVASVFVDPVGNDNGRPPWAWRYFPQNGTSMFQIARGVVFLDPAVHFRVKHDQPFKWTETGTYGISTEYCFNPYFGLDYRGVWPECPAP